MYANIKGSDKSVQLRGSPEIFIARKCDIENTKRVSFDIKFTRQGFKNACCLAMLAERFNIRSRSRAW